MALENWKVEHVSFDTVRPLVEKLHYAHADGRPCTVQHKHSFALFRPTPFEFWNHFELVGGCIYTLPSGPQAGQRYCPDDPEKVVELRRLCCVDETPKNAESFFVSKTLKWLTKNTDYKLVISYADPTYGHEGVIYKASNFEYWGKAAETTIYEVDGKLMHSRSFTIDRPYAEVLAARRAAGDENIKAIRAEGKHLFGYWLRK